MPAPTSYTEQTLAEWMQRELLAVADALGWTATDHTAYTDAVERVQRVLGGTIESQTNMPRLEAVAKVEIWERVLSERAGDYKFSTLAGTDERQQAFEQAERQVKRARAAASTYGVYPEDDTSTGRPQVTSIAVRNRRVW